MTVYCRVCPFVLACGTQRRVRSSFLRRHELQFLVLLYILPSFLFWVLWFSVFRLKKRQSCWSVCQNIANISVHGKLFYLTPSPFLVLTLLWVALCHFCSTPLRKGTLLHFCEAFDCVQWALLTERLTLSAPKNISNIVSCAKKERKIFYTTSNTFAYAVMSCTSQTESPLLSALLSLFPSHTIWIMSSF